MKSIPNKTIGSKTYLHVDFLQDLTPDEAGRIADAERLAKVRREQHFNLVRIDTTSACIALLNYPAFHDDPFPALRESWLVDLDQGTVSYRTYAESENPPILHRKELLLPSEHPRRETYTSLTQTAELIGLFDEPSRIGYRRQWLKAVREKGYRIDGHSLVPVGNDERADSDPDEQVPLHAGWQAARQLTALVRHGFSAPMQTLARYGFLDGTHTLFDYGCGRGDDVRGLTEIGIPASGWDPYHAPDTPLASAHIVNLGFVVNVIEDFDERLDALTRAFSLAEHLLVVSVMLANQNAVQGREFRDGVLTKRGTFQKYFSQTEIKSFVEDALGEEPIAVAPGVLYVFRDKDAEQRFLTNRYRRRHRRLDRPAHARDRESPKGGNRREARYTSYREPLDRLWQLWVSLGRIPEKPEVHDLATLKEGFGTLGRALHFLAAHRDMTEVERSRECRVGDLTVYFALAQFEHRKPYQRMEPGLRRDVRDFFGDYRSALAAGLELLMQIADTEAINQACQQAAVHGLGWLVPGESLQLHVDLVERLPPVLRVYIGCAALLYGDYRTADLVKIHIGSGKISLMRYQDFAECALPRMVERVKIKLREQDVDYFAYGDLYEPPFLYHKSRYINEEFPDYPDQVRFEEALEGLGLFDFAGFGPDPTELLETLARHRWTIKGFDLRRAGGISEIDAHCGRYLTFRDFIACGETQARIGLPNQPKQTESYNALCDLATAVIDPVIDWFGMIRLTYGFCSPELAREVPGRIDPRRDQHASHELNRRGNPICSRLGAAIDFIIDEESMLEVAKWIVANTAFDRLYYYGDDKPVHVSVGPDRSRQVVKMMPTSMGRMIPRVLSANTFLSIDKPAS